MSDTRLGLGKPVQQQKSLSSSALLPPLVPVLTQQASGMTRLVSVNQGGRISIRSPSQNNSGAVPSDPSSSSSSSTSSTTCAALSTTTSITTATSTVMATLLATASTATTTTTATTNSHPNLVNTLNSPNIRKRKATLSEDYVILRRKVTENHYIRLQRLQTTFAEQSAFLCFLQANGQLAEFSAWRSRLPATPLNNFFQTNKLNPQDENEDLLQVLQNRNNNLQTSGQTVRSNTQGTPETSRGSSDFITKKEQLPAALPSFSSSSSASPAKAGTSQSASSSEATISSQEQIVERAKQEAYVMQRIGELQRDGLWSEKRLPKVHELPRQKAHWDYLIEEMLWLAADFAQERKWKKAAAKKCARMVQKYFQDKEALAQKAIKAQEMQLKRIAGFIAKEVKQFWSNVEKLVEFKQHTRLEEKRKRALDQHLSFIVDQTEKYSSLVAESMNTTTSRQTSPKHHSDVEFEPEGSSDDDEETIAKEEALSAADQEAVSEELDALKMESELPLEELLSDYLAKRDELLDSPVPSNESNDDEFKASENESGDDEETIQEQENVEGSADHEEEINDLKAENDMTIEELRAKYGISSTPVPPPPSSSKKETTKTEDGEKMEEDETGGDEADIDENNEGEDMDEDEDVSETDDKEEEDDDDEEDGESDSEKEEDSVLKSLLNDDAQKDQEINDVAAIAQSLQPKGNTLSSTSVVTKVPFLLKHPLREYQHIGLDWLVTMYERKLNGILADEMGLGKTIQTIALIGHLACEKGNWGPHLIVVPTSVMLNWEMEFKKWCPAFKILTYYGSQKERKLKRSGWTKPNAFHICITSYKLVIQDHQSFRRKKWKYLILDEAQNIKNFKSQRWQLLLNFQTQRRLLLTGTPLQNNLMELWSLMHFLMPNVFESHREFKEWFSNPVTGMIEGNSEYNENIIKRLHKVLRPFLLRRLKSEVETQMPKKYEHIIMCRLSNRQRYLYDDFMSRAKTRETLATGNLLSVINVLMQLRKVCNHPNLFEVRPTVSPFQMEGLTYKIPSLVYAALDYNPFKHIDLASLNLVMVEFEMWLLAFVAHRTMKSKISPQLIKGIDDAPPEPPPCPKGRVKINIKKKVPLQPTQLTATTPGRPTVVQVSGNNHRFITSIPATKVGTSPLIKTVVGQNANQGVTLRLANPTNQLPNYVQLVQQPGGGVKAISVTSLTNAGQVVKAAVANSGASGEQTTPAMTRIVPQFAQLVNTPSGRQLVLSSQQVITSQGGVMTSSGQRLTVVSKASGGNVAKLVTSAGVAAQLNSARPIVRVPPLNVSAAQTSQQNCVVISGSTTATNATVVQPIGSTATVTTTITTTSNTITNSSNLISSSLKNSITTRQSTNAANSKTKTEETSDTSLRDFGLEERRKQRRQEKLALIAKVNEIRCRALPLYGIDLIESLTFNNSPSNQDWKYSGYMHCKHVKSTDPKRYWTQTEALQQAVYSVEERVVQLSEVFSRFVLYVPAVAAPQPRLHVPHPAPWKLLQEQHSEAMLEAHLRPKFRLLHPISSAMSTQFPHPRLIQYDCGKLQSLDRLLRKLKSEHHRVLIFTQMTRMLDVLEAFLNYHGHIYLRLDGTTKVDQRQSLMERFNADKRIFCFILSTRSGGVGINLTGADTVIFYDSDWNPTMDAQAQDRCHRIGQTRDVHIYRLVSEKTVEENILKKANQKRMLGDLAIEGGNFTTAYFKSSTIQDLFNVDTSENDASRRMAEVLHRAGERKISSDSQPTGSDEKSSIGALETALAQVEDESDVTAAKVAKAEAAAELAEFDENIPLDTQDGQELSKAELELNALMQQLTAIEKYAMRFVEETESTWSAEQLAAVEAEIEQKKREWEQERLAALRLEEEEIKENQLESMVDISEDTLTYSGSDARNQLWLTDDGKEIMPMWCPPTPPQDDSDVYIDHALGLLYQQNIMSESQLPPVFVKKERKRNRVEANLPEGGRGAVPPVKVRQREDTLMHAPRSLFDRPSPALIKMRQELRLQRYRGLMRPAVQNMLKPQLPVKPLPEPEHVPDWVIQEDWTILQAIQQIQELTLNLVVLSPAHTPNWDMVADMVNLTSRTYRSPKQCKNRYESVIIPREEGKLIFDSPRKQKKTKTTLCKPPPVKSGRPLRTSQLYQQDNNSSMTQVMNSRFDAIRSVSNRRAPTVKPLLVDPAMKNPKHAEVLSECAIDYDKPLSPIEVATKRADRIAKEKQAHSQQLQQQQQQQQHQQQQHSKVTQTAVAAAAAAASGVAGSGGIIAAGNIGTTVQTSAVAARNAQAAAAHLQEIAASGNAGTLRGVISSPTTSTQVQGTSSALQRSPTTNLLPVSVQTSPTVTTVKGTKTISAPQIVYQRQQHIQLKQQQLRVIQSRAGTAPGQKVSVAVTATSPNQRIQQVKAGGVTRTVSESEMLALLKRQQANKVSSSTASALTSAQILAQAGLQAQQSTAANAAGMGQVATLVKTVSANSLPVTGLTLPQMRAALNSGLKAGTVTPQQIRQLSLQQQIIAQHRKLPQQKVTQIGQVATKTGATAQLIVQSQKSLPTSVTMQQLQQVIKHVQPQNIVPAAQTSGTQVPHSVFTKATAGAPQARVIPVATATQQSIKQALQVVTAGSSGTVAGNSAATSANVPRTASAVTIDPSGRATQTTIPAGTIKAATSTQQAILTQVSAVLQQQGQPITVRQPVRIQATNAPLVAVAVSQATPTTVLTLPAHDNVNIFK